MKSKVRSILWGIFFILAAALIMLHQFSDLLAGITLLNLIITIIVTPIIIESLLHLNFFGVFFPIGLILILFSSQLSMDAVAWWAIMLAAFFLSLGCTFIFRPKRWNFNIIHNDVHSHVHNNFGDRIDHYNDSDVNFTENFSSSSKYLNASKLKNANVNGAFMGMKIFFDNADLNPEGARINFEISFSGIELYIPSSWRVINNVGTTLAGVDNRTHPRYNDGPILTLTGHASLSGVEVIYI